MVQIFDCIDGSLSITIHNFLQMVHNGPCGPKSEPQYLTYAKLALQGIWDTLTSQALELDVPLKANDTVAVSEACAPMSMYTGKLNDCRTALLNYQQVISHSLC